MGDLKEFADEYRRRGSRIEELFDAMQVIRAESQIARVSFTVSDVMAKIDKIHAIATKVLERPGSKE